jgi:hypothetical protein
VGLASHCEPLRCHLYREDQAAWFQVIVRDVVQDMTVENPSPLFFGDKFDVVALARRDVDRVFCQLRLRGNRMTVRAHNPKGKAVQVHWVGELSGADESEADSLPLLDG